MRAKQKEKGNLLYLSVGDEESYSQGMRAAVGLLADLKEISSGIISWRLIQKSFESNSVQEKVLHKAGT